MHCMGNATELVFRQTKRIYEGVAPEHAGSSAIWCPLPQPRQIKCTTLDDDDDDDDDYDADYDATSFHGLSEPTRRSTRTRCPTKSTYAYHYVDDDSMDVDDAD